MRLKNRSSNRFNSQQSESSSVAHTVIDKHIENTLSGGMSKRHATSFLFLNNLGIEYGIEYADIPVVIDAYDFQKPSDRYMFGNNKELTTQRTGKQIVYKSRKIRDEIDAFYICHMECLDWQLQYRFQAYESLLIFAKPDRSCAVSIRPCKKYVEIVIITE